MFQTTPPPPLSFRQKCLVVLIDLAVLAELCWAIRAAAGDMDTFTPVFLKTFFALLLPTLAAAFIANRMLKRRSAGAHA
jgi:hypothetical protein